MRYILYLLLVANVVYLGWNLSQENTDELPAQVLPPLPNGVRPLVTLQEHTGGMSSQLDAGGLNALTAAQPPAATTAADCRALGPFTVLNEAEVMAARLDEQGLDPVLRSVEGKMENGFLIYLQARDRDHSRQISRQLKDNNDNEYYIGKDNQVYLGTFDDIERASIRLEELRAIGLDATLGERFKKREEYWLEVPRRVATSDVLDRITGENPALQLHALSCL